MDNLKAEPHHEWLLNVYQNEGGNYSYFRNSEEKEFISPPPDRQSTFFQCRLSNDSYTWAKRGYIVAFPLTDIREPSDINLLADEMRELWQRRFELMAL
jgi:hypothetical protein